MKTCLVFKQNGEIEEKTIKKSTFDGPFLEFTSFKEYTNYIILYNEQNSNLNLTVFPFTKDRYSGTVCLLKIKDGKIKNLTIEIYAKKLYSQKYEKNDMYYSSDEELFSF